MNDRRIDGLRRTIRTISATPPLNTPVAIFHRRLCRLTAMASF